MTKSTRIRASILCIAIALAVAVYVQCILVDQNTNTFITSNALLAVSFLYLALLVTPLTMLFPTIPGKAEMIVARRALGVSAVLFATVHAYNAFFFELGGFAGLKYLGNQYILGITLSATALLILLLMAATSFDWAVRVLGRKWKFLHRFVYLAGFLILFHALILGTHFTSTTTPIYRTSFILVFILLGLEAVRIDRVLNKRLNIQARAGIVLVVVVSLCSFILPSLEGGTNAAGLSIHAQHIAIAQQAQTGTVNNTLPAPGVQGDPTKRFSVTFTHTDTIVAGEPADFRFHIVNAGTGQSVTQYVKFYEKYFHLLIVDENLTYFVHLHPTFDGTDFVVSTALPHDGRFHLYLNFQPFGGIEQAFAQEVVVGSSGGALDPAVLADTALTKTVNDYTFSLKPDTFRGSDMSVGKQLMSFTITKDGRSVTTMQPYLGAYGHMTLINTDTYEFLHVHPNVLVPTPPIPGGPTIDFLPLGLYGPIKPGVYRAFVEFNPDTIYTVVPFIITIQ